MHYFRRTATTDTTLGGERIAEGEKVVVWLADITRGPNPHLAFAHGTHFCLGAHLARLELRVTLPLLFERLPDLHLTGPPRSGPQQPPAHRQTPPGELGRLKGPVVATIW